MDPVTLSAISIGSSIAGGGMSAFGSMSEGSSKASMYGYQSSMATVNAKIAKQNADYTRTVGEVEAQQSGMKTSHQIAQTKVIQSASNFDVNSGSNAAVRESEHDIGVHDQNIIRNNAARKAYGYDVEAANKDAEAKMYGMAADSSRKSGKLKAISTLIGTAGSVADKWLQGSQIGIGGSAKTTSDWDPWQSRDAIY